MPQMNPYSIAAFRTQVELLPLDVGPAIRKVSFDAPGFRDHSLDEIVAIIDAAYPGSGFRCCNCHRRVADVKLRADDHIACDDCARWAGV